MIMRRGGACRHRNSRQMSAGPPVATSRAGQQLTKSAELCGYVRRESGDYPCTVIWISARATSSR
jgi:hypothetical protein